MKEASVKNDRRLVQVFLSTSISPGPGIQEVSTDKDGNLYCTCSSFASREKCKHTSFVEAKIKSNNGTYPLEILSKATPEEAELAKESNEAYRRFIIKYGKIEVF